MQFIVWHRVGLDNQRERVEVITAKNKLEARKQYAQKHGLRSITYVVAENT